MNIKLNEIKRTMEKLNYPMFLKRREEFVFNFLRIDLYTSYEKEPVRISQTCRHSAILCQLDTFTNRHRM